MGKVRFIKIFQIIIVLSITALLAGCGGGSGSSGGGDNRSTEQALSASITSPSRNVSIIKGASVDFQGNSSGGTSPYTFKWDFGGGATNSSTQNPGNVTFNTPGTYTVTFQVTDSGNHTSSSSVTITVNSPPLQPLVVAISSPTGNVTINTGQSVNFQGSITGGTAPYTYQWTINGGSPISSSAQNPGNVTFNTVGTYTINFQASDSSNQTSGASVVVTVNSPPTPALVASITSPSGTVTINPHQSVNFQGSVSGGLAPFTYLWTFGGAAPNSSVQNPGNVTFNTQGTYTVNFQVSDSYNQVSGSSVIITVKYPPLIAAISSPSGNVTINQGQSVNFQGTASGGSGSYTAFLWNFGGGATNSTIQNPGSVVFNNSGSYTVTFRVTDSAGNITTSSAIVVTVKDITPPTVTITSPTSGSTYNAGTATTLSIGGTCSDNMAVVSGTWANALTGGSGGITLGSPATTWSVSNITLANGSNVLTVIVYDAANNPSTAATLTVTSTNTPPPDHAPDTPVVTSVQSDDSWVTGNSNVIMSDNFSSGTISSSIYWSSYTTNNSLSIVSNNTMGGQAYALKAAYSAGASEQDPGGIAVCFGRNPAHTTFSTTSDFSTVYIRMYVYDDTPNVNYCKLSRASIFATSGWAQAACAHVWGVLDTSYILIDPVSGVSGSTLVTTGWNDTSHFTWLGSRTGTIALYGSSMAGQWHCVEYMMKLNTAGSSDGVQTVWIDGVQDVTETGLNFRGSYTSYGINVVSIDFSKNSTSNSADEVAMNRWVDNLVISTAPIGFALSPVNPIIYKNSFSDSDSGDTQASLEAEVSTSQSETGLVWDGTVSSAANSIQVNATIGQFSGALSGQSQLAYNAAYYARVRVSDGTDYSSWSAWYPLNTIQ